MQVRDLIELLQREDPYDHVKIESKFTDDFGKVIRQDEIETVKRENQGSPYVVIKCRE